MSSDQHACPRESSPAIYETKSFYDYRCLRGGDYRRLHGPFIRFGADGQIWYRGVYEGGIRVGCWEFFNPDGSVNHTRRCGSALDLSFNCPADSYAGTNHARNLHVCQSKSTRRLVGRMIEFYPWTKRLRALGSFREGKREGAWIYFKEDKTIDRILVYHQGELVHRYEP